MGRKAMPDLPGRLRKYKKKYKKKQKDRLRILNNELKTKCKDCGFDNKSCLEWRHRDGTDKKYTIRQLIYQAYSVKKFLAEIEKCICICANCNRKRYWTKDSVYSNDKGKLIRKLKERGSCSCGESTIVALDFHHVGTKRERISKMMIDVQYSLTDLKIEISKCRLTCVNCHRIEHNGKNK